MKKTIPNVMCSIVLATCVFNAAQAAPLLTGDNLPNGGKDIVTVLTDFVCLTCNLLNDVTGVPTTITTDCTSIMDTLSADLITCPPPTGKAASAKTKAQTKTGGTPPTGTGTETPPAETGGTPPTGTGTGTPPAVPASS